MMPRTIASCRAQSINAAIMLVAFMVALTLDSTEAFNLATAPSFGRSAKITPVAAASAPFFSTTKFASATRLFAEGSSDDEPTTVSEEVSKTIEEEAKPYPIDLPSPLLLSTSMILAIATTGMFHYYSQYMISGTYVWSILSLNNIS
jgi:hypothetical protein